jgi:hypothetical protein
LHWSPDQVVADFVISRADNRTCRVNCRDVHIIRVVEEMPLSTEHDDRVEGLVPNNFAYIVEGSKFWMSQSEAFRIVFPKLRHYQFVTGNNCLDVIAGQPPVFGIVGSGDAISGRNPKD